MTLERKGWGGGAQVSFGRGCRKEGGENMEVTSMGYLYKKFESEKEGAGGKASTKILCIFYLKFLFLAMPGLCCFPSCGGGYPSLGRPSFSLPWHLLLQSRGSRVLGL